MTMGFHSVPSGVLLDILSRLPVKTLYRSRCVSKSWRDIISDRFFVRLHRGCQRKRNPRRLFVEGSYDHVKGKHCLLFSSVDGDVVIDQFEADVPWRERDMLSSAWSCSEGSLVFCSSQHRRICVCNPSTRKVLLLPDPRGYVYFQLRVAFAYLPDKNQYKVVARNCSCPIKISVLTLDEGGIVCNDEYEDKVWKTVEEHLPHLTEDGDVPCVNGALHWVVDHGCYAKLPDSCKNGMIVSFSLETEKYNNVLEPKGCSKGVMLMSQLDGYLLLGDWGPWAKFPFTREGKIWILKDYERNSWEMMYRIDMKGIIDSYYGGEPSDPYDLSFLFWPWAREVIKESKEILFEMRNSGPSGSFFNYFTYTIETGRWSPSSCEKVLEGRQCSCRLLYYRESFFSLG